MKGSTETFASAKKERNVESRYFVISWVTTRSILIGIKLHVCLFVSDQNKPIKQQSNDQPCLNKIHIWIHPISKFATLYKSKIKKTIHPCGGSHLFSHFLSRISSQKDDKKDLHVMGIPFPRAFCHVVISPFYSSVRMSKGDDFINTIFEYEQRRK